MDPKVAYQSWLKAVQENNMDDAIEHAENVMEWLNRDGFGAFNTEREMNEFYAWYEKEIGPIETSRYFSR